MFWIAFMAMIGALSAWAAISGFTASRG